MDKITFEVERSRLYSKVQIVAGAFIIIFMSLTILVLALSKTPLTIKFSLFFLLPIVLIGIISLVIIKKRINKNIEKLKKEYQELEVHDENCRALLSFYKKGTFLKGPEFGDRIIIIQIKPDNEIKACKIFKENVVKIFKEKEKK